MFALFSSFYLILHLVVLLIQWFTPWEFLQPHSKKMLLTFLFWVNNCYILSMLYRFCFRHSFEDMCPFDFSPCKFFVNFICMDRSKYLWVIQVQPFKSSIGFFFVCLKNCLLKLELPYSIEGIWSCMWSCMWSSFVWLLALHMISKPIKSDPLYWWWD